MPALHVRNVPEETIALLKRRAAAHGRSLEGEIREIFEEAANAPFARVDVSFRERLVMSDAPAHGWNRADAYEERADVDS